MRIETVINAPGDVGCNARLPNLDELAAKARVINTRILDAERVGQGCVLASPAFKRIAHPTMNAEGRRTPALRFGDPRVMALTGALCQTLLAATGFTNKSLRALITGLLGSDHRPNQMTYDLRRLRRAGLIRRLPHTNPLHPHPRRHPHRHHLHQDLQPATHPAYRCQPTSGTPRTPTRATHPRPSRRRQHPPGTPPTPA